MLGPIFRWLGIEANARAIMTLLALGSALGATALVTFNRFAPLVSPSLSSTDFGEGYRRGRREAELEFRLRSTERSLEAILQAQEIMRKIEKMSDSELDALTEELRRRD